MLGETEVSCLLSLVNGTIDSLTVESWKAEGLLGCGIEWEVE
jgi:hypothetical protein